MVASGEEDLLLISSSVVLQIVLIWIILTAVAHQSTMLGRAHHVAVRIFLPARIISDILGARSLFSAE